MTRICHCFIKEMCNLFTRNSTKVIKDKKGQLKKNYFLPGVCKRSSLDSALTCSNLNKTINPTDLTLIEIDRKNDTSNSPYSTSLRRPRQLLEQFIFLLSSIVIHSILTSEEPLINLSDFNLTDISLAVVSLLSVLQEQAKHAEKKVAVTDVKSTSYSFYHFNFLFTFSFLVWLGFFSHTISLVSEDLCETVIVWPSLLYSFSTMLSKTLLLPICFFFFCAIFIRLLQRGKVNFFLFFLLLSTLYLLLIHILDLLTISSTLIQKLISDSTTSMTISSAKYSQDAGCFGWHKSNDINLMPFLSDSSLLFSTALNIIIILLNVLFISIELILFRFGLFRFLVSLRSVVLSLSLITLITTIGIFLVLVFLSSKVVLTSIIFSLI